MGTVPALLTSRWASGDLVGDAAHSCMVRIRAGFVNHFYEAATMLDSTPGPAVEAFPIIWKGHNDVPWQGQWTPTGDWITLTNIASANYVRSFDDKGGSTLTVVIDNIAFTEQTGTAGLYHAIERGWFSPTRGVVVSSRPTLWAANDFADVLNGGYQVELWEGYGVGSDVEPVLADSHWTAPSATKTWVGLIEECDLDSHPDRATLTCRDFSVLFTDQRLMGQNKATEIHSPVTFADRRKTLGQTKEFGSITVSSGSFTADDQLGAIWLSDTHTGPAHTEWVELHLPAGHYEDFYAAFPFNGEDMYVSLFAAGGASEMDGTTPVADGWVDLGLGTVPDDGEPYIFFHANTFASPSRRWSLGGHTWDLGDGSILRLSFTNLAQDPDLASPADRAGTNAFYAFRFGTDPLHPPDGGAGIHAQGWVLVEDAADVIRELCLWAGFKEMDIEDFGWTLQAPMSFGQDAFFQDVVDAIQAQGNYVWFIDAPTDHDMSLGVPVFRPQSATAPPPGTMVQILDSQLSEALEVKWDLSNLPYVMRFRGAQSNTGRALFEDTVKRYMGTYWPPWSGHDYTNLQGRNFQGTFPAGRVAGVRRQFSQTDDGLQSNAECLFACILAAIQYALQMVTATCQAAGYPGVSLDQQISVVDEGTGTNTRVWTASIESDHTLGPNGSWHMTLGGSVLDTEDMNMLALDYFYTFQRYVLYKVGT